MSTASEARDARHRQRQDEIIAAGRRCFRQSGFHAASMAQLASEAQLSVGQIYRYFVNKDAIIEEMVKRIIDTRLQHIKETATVELPRLLAWRYALDEDDEALMKEVAAEATRNPVVARMMAEADSRMFTQACQNVKRDHPEMSDEQTHACVEVMAVLSEGTAWRRQMPQKASSEHLYPLYQQINALLFKTEDS
ncbi:TetR/AcrR family transcriptional regulator [Kalamiella sp. sgz302252]|uniref:TetR/AcrR family transcriptional regulator n=1 Tax=Pantoea sp. sgz302252 TaxID=3341827 RepID=UPI0036D3A555